MPRRKKTGEGPGFGAWGVGLGRMQPIVARGGGGRQLGGWGGGHAAPRALRPLRSPRHAPTRRARARQGAAGSPRVDRGTPALAARQRRKCRKPKGAACAGTAGVAGGVPAAAPPAPLTRPRQVAWPQSRVPQSSARLYNAADARAHEAPRVPASCPGLGVARRRLGAALTRGRAPAIGAAAGRPSLCRCAPHRHCQGAHNAPPAERAVRRRGGGAVGRAPRPTDGAGQLTAAVAPARRAPGARRAGLHGGHRSTNALRAAPGTRSRGARPRRGGPACGGLGMAGAGRAEHGAERGAYRTLRYFTIKRIDAAKP
jgi:hypothetical protein